MLGAIAGDVIGSIFERHRIKTKEFPLFSKESGYTDDTVLTVAVAKAILRGEPYLETIRDFARRYPYAGYGGSFINWAQSSNDQPYNSWGNGSAMRVSPVGFACNNPELVLTEARLSAEITHNHPEGVKGAQATALSVFLARQSISKESIADEIERRFGYDLRRKLDTIRPDYRFDVSCQGSVPESIIAFLESNSAEDAIRNAISLGGDSDTMACIAGGIAEAYYGPLSDEIIGEVFSRLPQEFLSIIEEFYENFGDNRMRLQ
jgi:ADP-ribosylglycohydrolase